VIVLHSITVVFPRLLTVGASLLFIDIANLSVCPSVHNVPVSDKTLSDL